MMKFLISLLILLSIMQCDAQPVKEETKYRADSGYITLLREIAKEIQIKTKDFPQFKKIKIDTTGLEWSYPDITYCNNEKLVKEAGEMYHSDIFRGQRKPEYYKPVENDLYIRISILPPQSQMMTQFLHSDDVLLPDGGGLIVDVIAAGTDGTIKLKRLLYQIIQEKKKDFSFKVALNETKALYEHNHFTEKLNITYKEYRITGNENAKVSCGIFSISRGKEMENFEFNPDDPIPTITYWKNYKISIEEATDNYIILKIEDILTSENFDLLKNYVLEHGKNAKYRYNVGENIFFYENLNHNTRFELRETKDSTNIEMSKIQTLRLPFTYSVSNKAGEITLMRVDRMFNDNYIRDSNLFYKYALWSLAAHLNYIKRLKRGERTLTFFKKHLKRELSIKQLYQIFGEPDYIGSEKERFTWYIDKGSIFIGHKKGKMIIASLYTDDLKDELEVIIPND